MAYQDSDNVNITGGTIECDVVSVNEIEGRDGSVTVKLNGDTDKDPLDRGVEAFETYNQAFSFAQRMTSKGNAATIYTGEIMEMRHQWSHVQAHAAE